MATLPEIDPKQEPEAAATFAQVEASRGWVSNLMRAIAHAPEGLRSYSALGHYGRYGTALTEVQRELAICATVRGVDYGWTHHSNLARQIGVSDAQLGSLRAGRIPDGLGPAERALCEYVFAFTALRGVPDTVLAAARAHFTPRQITDLSLLSAYYMAAGALIVGLGVQVEPPEALQAELAWQKHTMSAG